MLNAALLGRTVAYYRVSSDEQKQGQTIRGQSTFVQNWCNARGIELQGDFRDEDDNGEGEFSERDGGEKLWRAAQRREFDTVVVFAVDRTGRTLYAVSHFFDKLKHLGIRVVSATQEFDPDGDSGTYLLALFSAQSTVDKRTIRNRTETGKATWQAIPGTYTGGQIPFGYTTVRREKRKYYAVCRDRIPNHDYSPEEVILTIFHRYHDGASLDRIADELNARGITPCWVPGDPNYGTPSRAPWRGRRVHRILTNPFYKGVQLIGDPRKGEWLRGEKRVKRSEPLVHQVPAIVSEELWEAVQQRLRANRSMGDRDSHQFYLLRGKVICQTCGRHCSGAPSVGAFMPRGRYYRCAGQTRGTCKGKWIEADALEGPIKEHILWVLGHSEQFVAAIQQQMGSEEEQMSRCLDRAAAIDRDRAKLSETELEYLRMFAVGLINSEEKLRILVDELKRKDATLRQEAEEWHHKALACAEAGQRLRGAVGALEAYHQRTEAGYSNTEWRELVNLLVDRVEIETQVVLPPAPRKRGQRGRSQAVAHPYLCVDLLALERRATSSSPLRREQIRVCLEPTRFHALRAA